MAINMNDKMGLLNEIIPEVFTNHVAAGIMVTGPRISNPVIIPAGRCGECKAPDPEHYELYTKEGVTIWSKRLKPRFVPYDYICDLPGHTFVKFKIKGQSFNLPHGCHDECGVKNKTQAKKTISVPQPPSAGKPDLAEDFINSITAATTGLDVSTQTSQQVLEIPLPPAPLPPIPELAKHFMDSVSSATTGLDMGIQTHEHAIPAPRVEEPISPPRAPTPIPSSQNELAEQFMNSISAATTGLDVQPRVVAPTAEDKEWQDVQEFMQSIAAATTGLDLGSTGQVHKRPMDRIEKGVEFTAPPPKQTIVEDVTEDDITDIQTL